MYISQNKKDVEEQERKQQELDYFYQKKQLQSRALEEQNEQNEAAEVEAKRVSRARYLKDALLHWRAPEFEVSDRDRKWYFGVTTVLLAIVAYAVFTNALIMAITFILIGTVGYIYIHKEPRTLDFALTEEGVIAGREIDEFDSLRSFWIFYEEDGLQVISFHTSSYLLPYVHIPIHDQDPVAIREILLEHLDEEKHEPGMLEVLDRILHL